jgi:hypothetical protein
MSNENCCTITSLILDKLFPSRIFKRDVYKRLTELERELWQKETELDKMSDHLDELRRRSKASENALGRRLDDIGRLEAQIREHKHNRLTGSAVLEGRL